MKKIGDMIKVHLPGEALWAEVTGTTPDGRVMAELRNESVHEGIHWGAAVVVARDGWEIEEPPEMVRTAEASCAAFRRAALD